MSKQLQIKSVYETADMWSVKWSYNAVFHFRSIKVYEFYL